MKKYGIEERELESYCDNTYAIYRHLQVVRKNLQRKVDKGTYDPKLAIKGFMHPVDAGAKSYCKEHGSPDYKWFEVFTKACRARVAVNYIREFEEEMAR